MYGQWPAVVLVLGAIMWGVTWWPLKYFNQQGLAGLPLILVGYGIVGVVLLPWLWRERHAWAGERRYVLLMLLLGGYANIAFALAMIYSEVVRAMMLFYLAPVWGVLGARLFLGELVDGRRALGVVLALAGAFLVLGGWTVFQEPPSEVDLLAITAGMAFALNNVTCRAAQGVPIMSKLTITFVGCGLMALAAMLARAQGVPSIEPATWLWLLVFGLGWLMLATLTTQWAVTHMEAGRASVLLITELLAAVLSAMLIGGETMSPAEMAGGSLILLAALIEARRAGEVTASPIP